MNSAAIRAFFDTRVAEWDSVRYSDETYIGRARAGIRFVCAAGVNRRVLDLGCGTGRQSVGLIERGQRVFSADFSPEMAKATRERILRECPGVVPLVVVADATRLPFRAGSFDSIMALGLVGFVQDRNHLLCELHETLGSEGEFVCDAGVPERQVLFRMITHAVERPLFLLYRLWHLLLRRPAPQQTRGWYAQNFIKHTPAEFEALLLHNNFQPKQRAGAGFGDLRVSGLPLLPWRIQSALTRVLNHLSSKPSGSWLARHALTYVVRSSRVGAVDSQETSEVTRVRHSRPRAPALR